MRSQIHYENFYHIYHGASKVEHRNGHYEGLEKSGEAVRPQKFFAFGLGYDDLIDSSIGHFKVNMKHKDTVEPLEIVPCSDTTFND